MAERSTRTVVAVSAVVLIAAALLIGYMLPSPDARVAASAGRGTVDAGRVATDEQALVRPEEARSDSTPAIVNAEPEPAVAGAARRARVAAETPEQQGRAVNVLVFDRETLKPIAGALVQGQAREEILLTTGEDGYFTLMLNDGESMSLGVTVKGYARFGWGMRDVDFEFRWPLPRDGDS